VKKIDILVYPLYPFRDAVAESANVWDFGLVAVMLRVRIPAVAVQSYQYLPSCTVQAFFLILFDKFLTQICSL